MITLSFGVWQVSHAQTYKISTNFNCLFAIHFVSNWAVLKTEIMNTYEIERKLGDKADKWELHSLQTENRELKSHVNELERKIGELQSINHNRYYALVGLFNLIAEHPQFSELQNDVYQLKHNL